MPTRQQKRARSRAPVRKRRKGQSVFVAVLLALVLGGGFTAALLRAQPRKVTRGAIQGEHWHADYTVEICGKTLADYPFVEGEIHTHGDGKIHIHPSTPAFTLDNANLGAFFQSVETTIGVRGSKRFIQFPNGDRYTDGGRCPGSSERYDLEVKLNGRGVDGDPGKLVLHNGDDVLVRFGPRATGERPNPLVRPTPSPAP